MPHSLKIFLIVYGVSSFINWFYFVLTFSKNGTTTVVNKLTPNHFRKFIASALLIPIWNTGVCIYLWLHEYPLYRPTDNNKRTFLDVILLRSKKTVAES